MSNFTRKDFKISFIDSSYFVNASEKVVVCFLSYRVNFPRGGMIEVPWYFGGKFKATGVARCSSSDKFDVAKGKKIALAKAEDKAYISVGKKIKRFVDELESFTEISKNFLEKMDSVIEHNADYIDRIDSEPFKIVENKVKDKKVCIICPEHGEFW